MSEEGLKAAQRESTENPDSRRAPQLEGKRGAHLEAVYPGEEGANFMMGTDESGATTIFQIGLEMNQNNQLNLYQTEQGSSTPYNDQNTSCLLATNAHPDSGANSASVVSVVSSSGAGRISIDPVRGSTLLCSKEMSDDCNESKERSMRPYIENDATEISSRVMIVAVMSSDDESPRDRDKSTSFSGPFQCKYCSIQLQTYQQMKKHYKEHAEEKPFKCHVCSQDFNVEVNLRLHKAASHYEGQEKPKCPECAKSFSRMASLKAHLLVHQQDEYITCSECGVEFATEAYLKKHVLKKHLNSGVTGTEKKRKSSRNYQSLLTKDNDYNCLQCKQAFPSSALLKEHVKLHSKIKNSLKHRTYKKVVDRSGFSHKCETCEKTFKKRSQLIRHIRVHTKEKPFSCEVCGKAFSQKNTLEIHRKATHTGEKKYNCKFCDTSFTQPGNMRAHIDRVHAPQISVPSEQLFQCPFCSCVFKKVGSLNGHVSRRHSSLVPTYQSLPETFTNQTKPGLTAEEQENVNNADNCCAVPEDEAGQQLANVQVEKRDEEVLSYADLLSKALANNLGVNIGDKLEPNVKTNNECLNSGVNLSEPIPLRPPDNKPGVKSLLTFTDTATGSVISHIVRRVDRISYHQCLYCPKEFKKSSDLVRHIRIHFHERPFKCSQCFRSFTVKSTLTAHLRTHSGIKGFGCDVCNKNVSTQQSLKVHTRIHTGSLPYPCTICQKKFRTSGQLKAHLASHQRKSSAESGRRIGPTEKIIDAAILAKIQLQEPIVLSNESENQMNSVRCPPTSLLQPKDSSSFGTDIAGDFESVSQVGSSSRIERPVNDNILSCDQRNHECCYCQKAFKKSSHLKQHLRSHTKEKPFHCVVCSQGFVSNGSLKIHQRAIHSREKPYRCVQCNFHFTTKGSLTRHMNTTHSNLRPFMCPYCLKTFKASLNVKKHMKLHRTEFALQLVSGQKSEQQPRDSSTAVPTIVTVSSNAINGNSEGDAASRPLQSTDVKERLHQTSQGQELNESKQLRPPQGPAPQSTVVKVAATLVQGVDRKKVASAAEEDTDDHKMDATNEDKERRHSCLWPDCGMAFKKRCHLQSHTLTHTGERPFSCNVCGKSFATRGTLTTHASVHSTRKEYLCSECGNQFSTSQSLRRHVAYTHPLAVQKRCYKCPICSVQFKTQTILMKHMRTSHQEHKVKKIGAKDNKSSSRELVLEISDRPAEAEAEGCPQQSSDSLSPSFSEQTTRNRSTSSNASIKLPHQCQHCPKGFKKPSDLVRHIRIHTGEKPFECDICSKQFTVKSTLESHKLTHKKERNFKCYACNSHFSTKGSLKVHYRLHSGLRPFKCPQCDQCFRTSGHRKAHVLRHAKEKTTSIIRVPETVDNNPPVEPSTEYLENESRTEDILVNQEEGPPLADQTLVVPIQEVQDSVSASAQQTAASFQIDTNLLAQLIQMDPNLMTQLQQHGVIITQHETGPNAVSMDATQHLPADCLEVQFSSTSFEPLSIREMAQILCDNCKATFNSEADFEAHENECASMRLNVI